MTRSGTVCLHVKICHCPKSTDSIQLWPLDVKKYLRSCTFPGDINGNSETEVNRPSVTGDSCHSCISLRRSDIGCFPTIRSTPCLMLAFPMMVLHQTPTLVSTGNIATDCLWEDSWHCTFWSGKTFSYCCEAVFFRHHSTVSPSQWCHSLWRSLLFHMLKQVNFVFLIKLIFKHDSMKRYNVKVLRQNEAPHWAKILIL